MEADNTRVVLIQYSINDAYNINNALLNYLVLSEGICSAIYY